MTAKTTVLTSYDVPQDLRDRINAMATVEEVEAYQDSVKSPNRCAAGDLDLTVWWACESVLAAERNKDKEFNGKPNMIAIEDLFAMDTE